MLNYKDLENEKLVTHTLHLLVFCNAHSFAEEPASVSTACMTLAQELKSNLRYVSFQHKEHLTKKYLRPLLTPR